MVFTNRSERNQKSVSPEPPTNKRKIDSSTSSTGENVNGLFEVNSSQEDSFFFQVTNSFSEHCANCSVKFPISESGQAQTVKEFMSQNKATGEFTKVSVWKALSVIYQLRIRMYNNIEIATAFCLGEDGNRDLSICIRCAMSLCRLYKFYIEFQEFSSQDSYISKLIKDKENTRPFSPPVSPAQSSNSRTKPTPITPIAPTRSSAKSVFPRTTLSVNNCNQRPLNLITNKNRNSNIQKMDWSPVPVPAPPLSSSNSNNPRPHIISSPVAPRPQELNPNGQPLLQCGICSSTFLSQILRTPCMGQRNAHRPHGFIPDKNNPEPFAE